MAQFIDIHDKKMKLNATEKQMQTENVSFYKESINEG